MNTEEVKTELSKMVEIETFYLMGTKAFHQLGDISRQEYDLFRVGGETENHWVGMWTTGFGFFNVLFPKETSRELTKEEIDKYNKTYIQINSQIPVKLNVSKESEGCKHRNTGFVGVVGEVFCDDCKQWLD